MARDVEFQEQARKHFGLPYEEGESTGAVSGQPGEESSVSDVISNVAVRAVEFRRLSKSWVTFPYHTMLGVEFVPNSRVIVMFPAHRVTVEGRALRGLYESIRAHRCERVAEAQRADQFSRMDALVDKVTVLSLRKE